MSAVDVLAVMERAATTLAMTAPLREKSKPAREMREARAAVAELIEAADICAEAFADYLDADVPDVIGRRYPSYVRLRAALARIGAAP